MPCEAMQMAAFVAAVIASEGDDGRQGFEGGDELAFEIHRITLPSVSNRILGRPTRSRLCEPSFPYTCGTWYAVLGFCGCRAPCGA